MYVPRPVFTIPTLALGGAQGTHLEALAILLRTLALLTVTTFTLGGHAVLTHLHSGHIAIVKYATLAIRHCVVDCNWAKWGIWLDWPWVSNILASRAEASIAVSVGGETFAVLLEATRLLA